MTVQNVDIPTLPMAVSRESTHLVNVAMGVVILKLQMMKFHFIVLVNDVHNATVKHFTRLKSVLNMVIDIHTQLTYAKTVLIRS